MTKIINLNKKRKEKARKEKKKRAAQNRIKFGRTKEEKQLVKANNELEKRKLDGHKLENSNKEEDS